VRRPGNNTGGGAAVPLEGDTLRAKIHEVGELIASTFKPLRGTWAIESCEDGEIAVCRDSSKRPIAFMAVDVFKRLKAQGRL